MKLRTILAAALIVLAALTLVGAPSAAASPVVWYSAHVQDAVMKIESENRYSNVTPA